MNIAHILSFLTLILYEVQSLNILGVFPYQGKSHFYVFDPYLRELTRRGHNVTVITPFPLKIQASNYRDISLADKVKVFEDFMPIHRSYLSILQIAFLLTYVGADNCRIMLENEEVQHLWKSKAKFDVVVVEQFNSDCALGLAYKLGAPVVGITSHTLMPWQYSRFGVPYNPAYIPVQFVEGGTKPTLYQRVERTLIQFYFTTVYKYTGQREDENTLRKYFDDVPPLEELGKEIKVLLWYMHHSLTGTLLLPQKIQEVNGYHVAEPKSLPSVSPVNLFILTFGIKYNDKCIPVNTHYGLYPSWSYPG